MKKIELSKDIFVYEDFLTEQECAAAINVLDKLIENNKISWMPISFYESYSSTVPQDDEPELKKFGLSENFFSNLKKRIIDTVAEVSNKPSNKIVEIGWHTQKWEPGAYARVHSDNSEIDGAESPFERSHFASFLYLNDDFEGGDLRFVNQDITIKPKVGMLATFAGTFHNLHEVTMITKGTRYTIGSFWDDRDESEYPEETRKKWEDEMKKIREQQEIERAEWQDLLKEGYKIDLEGKKYKFEGQNE